VIKIVTAVLIATFFIILAALSKFPVNGLRPPVMSKLEYVKPNFTSVTDDMPAGFCTDSVGGFYIMELASFNMLAHQIPNHTDMFGPMVQYLSTDHEFVVKPAEKSPDWPDLPLLFVQDRNNHTAYSIQGVTNARQLCVLFDKVLAYWYSVGMGLIVPFFEVVNNLFLSGVLCLMASYVYGIFLGLSFQGASLDPSCISGLEGYPRIVVTGHSSGGLYAKDTVSGLGCYGVAFESPQMFGSTLQLFSDYYDDSSRRISNVYSAGSLFSMMEHGTIQNLYLPSYQSHIKPANPYETFCLIAAGCVIDDRYDHLCSSAIGEKVYLDYFKKWDRRRDLPLTSVGSPDNSMVPLPWS
jgi:hypothetical protein